MAAAENDALPRGKVGGIGDVVRDIPLALANIGHQVDVVMPGYGYFSTLPGAEKVSSLTLMFAGNSHSIDIFKVPSKHPHDMVTQWVIEHQIFATGGVGKIYCDDPDNRPFASDATKFALFSTAVANAMINNVFGKIDVLHLHDWHTAMIAMLRAYDPQYHALQNIKTVYTIHNLALQGIRPLNGDNSSLAAWFPDLDSNSDFDINSINDPRYPHCINPMRVGINLSDKVHAVSPTYATEILSPSNYEAGHYGGEGLEATLNQAKDSAKLHGILNGCEYHENKVTSLKLPELLPLIEGEVLKWLADQPLVDSAHLIALTRIKQLSNKVYEKPPTILTSVGRVTDQKVTLFQQTMASGETALAELLTVLADDGLFILLGSGDSKLESFLTDIAAKHANFIFLKGYSETLSENLYSSGDLFLMPSSFEPCGISQMLAMRAGQPVLAHSVGGLADTIIDQQDGFTFSGDTPQQQAENMLSYFQSLISLKEEKPKQWSGIAKKALEKRFLWPDSAQAYVKYLYQ